MTEESGARITVEFILNVLKQHENDLDRTVAELELELHKVEGLVHRIEKIADKFSNIEENITEKQKQRANRNNNH